MYGFHRQQSCSFSTRFLELKKRKKRRTMTTGKFTSLYLQLWKKKIGSKMVDIKSQVLFKTINFKLYMQLQ